MQALYNEIDPYAAEWLRNLIKRGHIAPGVVDTRDIRDLSPDDLKPYTQVHFFAGIGGWSLALRQAGWPDNRPVWTGSCPCQPFSNSGAHKGFDDERHLWPAWFRLIRACQPAAIFGEQVAAKAALEWFDLVSDDLEGAGYAVGAADLCAAGVTAPHIRQRLWFGATRRMAHPDGGIVSGASKRPDAAASAHGEPPADRSGRSGDFDWVDHAHLARSQGRSPLRGSDQRATGTAGLDNLWQEPDWLWCQDGKYRPTQPGLCPLADGLPARVGRLRAYGNAIVPQVGAAFVQAFEESL